LFAPASAALLCSLLVNLDVQVNITLHCGERPAAGAGADAVGRHDALQAAGKGALDATANAAAVGAVLCCGIGAGCLLSGGFSAGVNVRPRSLHASHNDSAASDTAANGALRVRGGRIDGSRGSNSGCSADRSCSARRSHAPPEHLNQA